MELLRLKCPACHSTDIQYHSSYTTKNHGGRVMYQCENCPASFSETKNTLLEGLKTPVSVIWQVVKARTEGMGLNASPFNMVIFGQSVWPSRRACRSDTEFAEVASSWDHEDASDISTSSPLRPTHAMRLRTPGQKAPESMPSTVRES